MIELFGVELIRFIVGPCSKLLVRSVFLVYPNLPYSPVFHGWPAGLKSWQALIPKEIRTHFVHRLCNREVDANSCQTRYPQGQPFYQLRA